jgi:PAS domain S-box-containing protein
MLEAILRTAVGAIITIDERGIVQNVNPATEVLFGYAESELIGNNVSMLMPEPHRGNHDGYLHSHITTGVKKIIGIGRDVEGLRKNGDLFPMHLSVSAFTVEGTRYFAGIIHDLTERDRIQGELRRQGSIFEAVFNNVPEALLITDDQRNITLSNAAVTHLFQWSPNDLLGRSVAEIFSDKDEFDRADGLRAQLSFGGRLAPFQASYRRRDGTIFPGQTVGAHILDADGQAIGFLSLVRDLTHEIEQMRTLHSAQRMEAFGQLTGGIAHDFNNLLTVITGNHELLEMRLDDDRDRTLLKRAQDAAEMGARLTDRLLTFARRRQLETVRLNLNDQVLEMAELLRRTLGEDLHFATTLSPGLWSVVADPSEIENAILNLAINARDAMRSSGKLVIETANIQIDSDTEGGESALAPGPYVRLSVSDTGSGMSSEVLEKAFEPFYTTKSPGKGTGLGLSTIYGFVRQLGGGVTIYSEVGHGSTINVYIPAAEGQAAGPSGEEQTANVPVSLGELILLVEDNDEVREVTKQRLVQLGYEVLEAASGQAAVDILEAGHNADLVFSDVVMPGGMSGFDVVRWVRSNVPAIKVLLSSGFADEVVRDQDRPIADITILRKPYNRSELAHALRRLLDGDADS